MASSRVGTRTSARGRRGADDGAAAASRATVGRPKASVLPEPVRARVGDRGRLDRERLGDPVASQPFDQPLGQLERRERVVGGDLDRPRKRATGGLSPGVGGEALGLGIAPRR